jgi:hypothetical protein
MVSLRFASFDCRLLAGALDAGPARPILEV